MCIEQAHIEKLAFTMGVFKIGSGEGGRLILEEIATVGKISVISTLNQVAEEEEAKKVNDGGWGMKMTRKDCANIKRNKKRNQLQELRKGRVGEGSSNCSFRNQPLGPILRSFRAIFPDWKAEGLIDFLKVHRWILGSGAGYHARKQALSAVDPRALCDLGPRIGRPIESNEIFIEAINASISSQESKKPHEEDRALNYIGKKSVQFTNKHQPAGMKSLLLCLVFPPGCELSALDSWIFSFFGALNFSRMRFRGSFGGLRIHYFILSSLADKFTVLT